jgi:hypothetical protein
MTVGEHRAPSAGWQLIRWWVMLLIGLVAEWRYRGRRVFLLGIGWATAGRDRSSVPAAPTPSPSADTRPPSRVGCPNVRAGG